MKFKLWIPIILGIVLVVLLSGYVYFSRSNLYQTDGEATLKGLTAADSGFRKEVVKIRLTRRGPVISGILKPLTTGKVVTLRWAPFETMEPSL